MVVLRAISARGVLLPGMAGKNSAIKKAQHKVALSFRHVCRGV
jgi:hypothetical protein